MEDSGIDSDAKPSMVATLPLSSDSSAGGNSPKDSPDHRPSQNSLTSRFISRGRYSEARKAAGSLLPLQRLDIPGNRETQPLVEWDTDDSSDDVSTFFQTKPSQNNIQVKPKVRSQIPADVLLVEELTPSEDDGDDDPDDLELVINDKVGPVGCCVKEFCIMFKELWCG